jgi:hypothetical protein
VAYSYSLLLPNRPRLVLSCLLPPILRSLMSKNTRIHQEHGRQIGWVNIHRTDTGHHLAR